MTPAKSAGCLWRAGVCYSLRVVKRTLWSILTAAAAAVLPGFTGPTLDLAQAPVAEAVKPAGEALAPKKAEVREQQRELDEHDDDPAREAAVAVAIAAGYRPHPEARAAERVTAASPDVAPLARRALGPPRVRAPDTAA